jgi:hypothetical protein
MNKTQLRRWKKVSIGLARDCHPNMTEARRAQLVEQVADCIDTLVWNNGLEPIKYWDGNRGTFIVCDAVSNFVDERHYHVRTSTGEPYENRFARQVNACVRAGFDLAVAPSAGVTGFTIGDLRTIFNRRLPQWVKAFFTPPLSGRIADNEPVWL